jgi:hypothetical protein
MIVPRRVGIEASGDFGRAERLALSSRLRGELVSLGSAGGGWTVGWLVGWLCCAQYIVCFVVVSQCLTLSNERRFRQCPDIPRAG